MVAPTGHQCMGADAGSSAGGGGVKVLAGGPAGTAAEAGNFGGGDFRVTGTAVSFCGGTGFAAGAAPVGLGGAERASFCLSSGLRAW